MEALYDSIKIDKHDIGKSKLLISMTYDELCSLTVTEINGHVNQRLKTDLVNASWAVEQKEYNLR